MKRLFACAVAGTLVATVLFVAVVGSLARSAPVTGTPYVNLFKPPSPPLEEVLELADGQAYAAIARDPALEHASSFRTGDAGAAYRASRPLYAYTVWVVSFGQGRAVPAMMAFVTLAAAGLATAAAGMLLRHRGQAARYGIVVALLPGALASISELTPELLALAIGLFGVVAYERRRVPLAIALFTAAVLTRETMILLPVGVVIEAMVREHRRRFGERDAAMIGVPAASLLLWYSIVRLRFGAWPPSGGPPHTFSIVPYGGFITSARHWHDGMTIGIGLATVAVMVLVLFASQSRGRGVVCAYALLVPFMGSAVYDSWKDFSRPLLPMFAFGALCAFEAARARTERSEAAPQEPVMMAA